MAITANIGIPIISLIAGDNTVLNPAAPVVRDGIQTATIYNTTGANITVDFYESPDLTSASGDLFSTNGIAANSSIQVSEIEGQGFEAGQNLIAVASAIGCNLKVTVTETTT